jgi:hypothetical protein
MLNGKVPSVDSPPEKKLSGAHARAAALTAQNPAYKRYARYTEGMLEADMDRPSAAKSKGWASINTEEVRIKADIIRHSTQWPICMPYAVLTLRDLGLTYEQAARKGIRVGEDDGQDTMVLDEDGKPKPYTQAWIARNLGMKKQNVTHRVKNMVLKKILVVDGKRLTIDPAPPVLSEDERKKVIRSDYFLDQLPQYLQDAINGFKPRRPHLEALAKLPEVICLDYFQRLHDIHSESEKKLDVIRLEREKAMDDILAEVAILIDKQVPQLSQGEASSSLEREQSQPETTTTILPEQGEDLHLQPETETIREALEPYCGEVDQAGVETLIHKSLERVADLMSGELTDIIHERGPIAKTKKNPFGFLLTDVPNRITPETIDRRRQKRRPKAVGCPKCGLQSTPCACRTAAAAVSSGDSP